MGGGEGVKFKKKTIYFFILNHFKKAKAFRGVVPNININTVPVVPVITEKFNLKKGNFDEMRKFINDVDWKAELQNCNDVDDCWDKIEGMIQLAINKFTLK